MRRWIGITVSGVAAAFVLCALTPEALAFPYRATIGDTTILADRPIPAQMRAVLHRSDVLLRRSAIYGPGYGRRIFLTDGGWRWHLLAAQSSTAFAISRPVLETIVVNRSDIARDRVETGRAVAGVRSLSGVIAHERTHGLIRARYGATVDMTAPAWLREGYCDTIAGGGSLSDGEAARLEARAQSVPALAYYHGRKRVAALLRAGRSVDSLFAGAVR